MQKKAKIKTPPLPIEQRQIIAANVKRLIFDRENRRDRTPMEVQAMCGVSYKSVERILKASPDGGGPTVATIYWLAHSFDAEPWELLRPGYRQPLLKGSAHRPDEGNGQTLSSAEGSAKRNALIKGRK